MHQLYRFLVRLHPQEFRHRFADQMLSIFEEQQTDQSPLSLLVDCLRSLLRQWLRQAIVLTCLLAVGAAALQFRWFIYRRKGHQTWSDNPVALTPYTEAWLAVMLVVFCALLFTVLSLAAFNVRGQIRRSERHSARISR